MCCPRIYYELDFRSELLKNCRIPKLLKPQGARRRSSEIRLIRQKGFVTEPSMSINKRDKYHRPVLYGCLCQGNQILWNQVCYE